MANRTQQRGTASQPSQYEGRTNGGQSRGRRYDDELETQQFRHGEDEFEGDLPEDLDDSGTYGRRRQSFSQQGSYGQGSYPEQSEYQQPGMRQAPKSYGQGRQSYRSQGANYGREGISSREFETEREMNYGESQFGYGSSRQGGANRGFGQRSIGERRSNEGQGSGVGQGQHFGKGPKGYRRSDERITEEICDQLTAHGDIDPSEVEVKVRNGEVTLTGTVDSRHAKRLAEDLAEDVSGVAEVINQIRIRREAQHTGEHGSRSGESVSKGAKAGNDRG
jgi:osmotically-inducible protein OsmY